MDTKKVFVIVICIFFFVTGCSTLKEKSMEILEAQIFGQNETRHTSTRANASQPHASSPIITSSGSNNIDIQTDRYDGAALDKYFGALKNAVQFLSAASPAQTEQRIMFQNWSNFIVGQMRVNKIEVEEWPLEARQKGWDAMGSRITKYNKLFEENRQRIISDDSFEESFQVSLKNINLLTQQNMFTEQQFVEH